MDGMRRRDLVGCVNVAVLPDKDGNFTENETVATYPLPGKLKGKVIVQQRRPHAAGQWHILCYVVEVQGFSSRDNMLVKSRFEWETRPPDSGCCVSTWEGESPDAKPLQKNTVLATFPCYITLKITGVVSVYGPPAAAPGRLEDFTTLRDGLSDVRLRAAGVDFPVHRNVLAARSPFFKTMFTSGFKEAGQEVVKIEQISPEVFAIFVDFLYSGALGERSCEVLLALLELGERFQVDALKQQCVHQLLGVDAGEALLVFQATLQENSLVPEAVSRRAVDVIKRNWTAVSASDEWPEFAAASLDVARALALLMEEDKPESPRPRPWIRVNKAASGWLRPLKLLQKLVLRVLVPVFGMDLVVMITELLAQGEDWITLIPAGCKPDALSPDF